MNIKSAPLIFFMLALSGTSVAGNATNYNWTGAYVGGFIGGADSSTIKASEPYSHSASNYWYENFHAPFSYETSASFIGGGTIGYNWQIANTTLVLSLEGEYGYMDIGGSQRDPNSVAFGLATSDPSANVGIHSTNIAGAYGYGLAGGRIGYALDRTLLYVKSGALFTNVTTRYDDQSDNAHLRTSSKRDIVGYAIGGGVEYALPFEWAQNFTIKTEYLWLGIEGTQTSSGLADAPEETYHGANYSAADNISGIHTAKIGINYKF